MNVVLIGYRGTGKSVVAAILSRTLERESVSMDREIADRAGMSIPEFVQKNGWTKFRYLESEVAVDLSRRDGIIVDCGGGVIERSANIEALRVDGVIIWLKASVDVIVRRISAGTERPALTEGKTFTEEVEEVLERRTPLYAAAAGHEIDTDYISPEQAAGQIARIINDLS